MGRKGVVKVVQSGVVITIAIALGRYVWEAPKREKLAHYQAWQMINSATGQKTSGGRIQALQDLNKDEVSLQGLDASGANLYGINLQKAYLSSANLRDANLDNANLNGATLYNANLGSAYLYNANLGNADLYKANLGNANLIEANLGSAYLDNANFKGAKNITPEQIKQAKNWQSACYDPDFRIKLRLPPQNPKHCAGDEPKK